jgi:transcription antitermination factor NusG
MPGVLFVPVAFLGDPRRDEIFRYLHAYGFMMSCHQPATLSKEDIGIIREIETKLNLPDDAIGDAVGEKLVVGARVRFLNEVYAAFFGDGMIVEVASHTRIGVEVAQLFGGRRKAYWPASEIEVM